MKVGVEDGSEFENDYFLNVNASQCVKSHHCTDLGECGSTTTVC